MGSGKTGYIKNVKVTKNSRHRGVGTRMLSNFLMHLKGKHPEVGSVYLMVQHGGRFARKMYENAGFKELEGASDTLFSYYRCTYPPDDQ